MIHAILLRKRKGYGPVWRRRLHGGGTGADGIKRGTADMTSTMHRDAVTQDVANCLINDISSAREIAPFAMTSEAVDLLIKFGIPASQSFTGYHRHPMHKAIENFLLLRVVPKLVTSTCTCMWLKPAKFEKLRTKNDFFVDLINPEITPRDASRYAGTVSRGLPNRSLFLHDAMHYLSKRQVLNFFLSNPDLDELVATVVYPSEVLLREQSFFPLAYGLVYTDTGFTYTLEGDPSDAYHQPFNDWVITTSKLTAPNITITFERVEGVMGHHVIIARRGSIRTPPRFLAPMPDCVLLPDIGVVRRSERSRLVPSDIYDKAVHHARNLKSLRFQDAVAKVRSYQHSSSYHWVDPTAWDFLTGFVCSAANVTVEPPNIAAELDHHPWWNAARRIWTNRRWKPFIGAVFAGAVLAFPPLVASLPLKTVLGLSVSSLLCFTSSYFAYPEWQSPEERERRRLAILYPPRFSRMVKMTSSYLTSGSVDQFEVSLADTNSVFSEFRPLKCIDSTFPEPFDASPADGVNPDLTPYAARSPSEVGSSSSASLQSRDEHDVPLPDDREPLSDSENGSVDSAIVLPKLIVTSPSVSTAPPASLPKPSARATLGPHGRVNPKPLNRRDRKAKKKAAARASAPPPPITYEHGQVEGKPARRWLYERANLPSSEVIHDYHLRDASGDELFDGNFQGVPLCLLDALSAVSGQSKFNLIEKLKLLPQTSVVTPVMIEKGLSDWHAAWLAYCFGWDLTIKNPWDDMRSGVVNGVKLIIYWTKQGDMGHFSHVAPPRVTPSPSDIPSPGNFHGATSGTRRFAEHLLSWRGVDGSAVPFLGFRGYTVRPHRAKPLARDMANGHSGIAFGPSEKRSMDPDTFVRWKTLVEAHDIKMWANRPRCHVAAIYGYPGCGKSWPVSQVLKSMGSFDFRVAVPTVELREEWQRMLNLPDKDRWRVGTYESTMRKHTEVLIIDEISMMPAGYVDFLMSISPRLRCVLILGDVTQTDRHETDPDATCAKLVPEAMYWKNFSPFYLGYTRRLCRSVADRFSVKTFSSTSGLVTRREVADSSRILVALSGDAKAICSLGSKAVTFPSSQGCTYRETTQIQLDRSALEKCSLGAVHTAVTRSTAGVVLVGSLTGNRLKVALSNPFWCSLLTGRRVNWQQIFADKLTGFEILEEPYRVNTLHGGAIPESDLTFVEHNFPLEYLPPSRRVGHTQLREELPIEFALEDVEAIDDPPSVTWGQLDSALLFRQIYVLRPVDCHERLRRHGMEPSQQFSDEQPEGLNVDGDYPENIAARHKSSDRTLLPLSVPKRLRFGSKASNKKEVLSKFFVGQSLFKSYCRLMKIDPTKPFPFDDRLFHSCIELNEWHSLSVKTRAAISANEYKSDPDWAWTFIRLFMKQQRKVNVGTLNGDWKAGQTISNMNDQWLLFLGPAIRYMTALEHRYCPPRIYLHGGRSNIDLDRFCRKWLRSGKKYANDYTAFDQSQTGEVLASELLYMWHAGLPQHVIDLYEENKTSMTCFLGSLRTMRFSGEPATYAFNCRCNLAVLNLQFPLDVMEHLPVFVSGDDGGIGGVPPERDTWDGFKRHLSLVAKPEVESRLLFVGYICTHLGAIRDPVPMLARLYVAEDAGRLHLIVQSYATELSTGYLLAEGVFEVLTSFELDCFFCLVRAFHLEGASSRLKFRKDALLGFVRLSEKALGRMKSGSKLGPELKRDLAAFFWRLERSERDAVHLQTQELVRGNLLEFSRRA